MAQANRLFVCTPTLVARDQIVALACASSPRAAAHAATTLGSSVHVVARLVWDLAASTATSAVVSAQAWRGRHPTSRAVLVLLKVSRLLLSVVGCAEQRFCGASGTAAQQQQQQPWVDGSWYVGHLRGGQTNEMQLCLCDAARPPRDRGTEASVDGRRGGIVVIGEAPKGFSVWREAANSKWLVQFRFSRLRKPLVRQRSCLDHTSINYLTVSTSAGTFLGSKLGKHPTIPSKEVTIVNTDPSRVPSVIGASGLLFHTDPSASCFTIFDSTSMMKLLTVRFPGWNAILPINVDFSS